MQPGRMIIVGLTPGLCATAALAHGLTRQKHTETVAKVLPVTNYPLHLTVAAAGSNKSEEVIKAMTGVYYAGLDALKAKLEKNGR